MNIVGRGVLLIVYLFILIVVYLVISTPFDITVQSFGDLNRSASDGQMDQSVTLVRATFDFCFGLAGIIPILWFIVWVYSREPDWRYYQ